jgi:hypothetical protein
LTKAFLSIGLDSESLGRPSLGQALHDGDAGRLVASAKMVPEIQKDFFQGPIQRLLNLQLQRQRFLK